jgi:hypothetical protein
MQHTVCHHPCTAGNSCNPHLCVAGVRYTQAS